MWRVLKSRGNQNSSPLGVKLRSKRFETTRPRCIERNGTGKMKSKVKGTGTKRNRNWERRRLDWLRCKKSLPCLPTVGWTDGPTATCYRCWQKSPSPLPWSRRNASSAISSYRYRQSGGKGHHHFFYVPHSGHVGHCRGFCFPSLFRAPLIDVSIPTPPFSKLPTISPSTNHNGKHSAFELRCLQIFSNQLFLRLFEQQRNLGPLPFRLRWYILVQLL